MALPINRRLGERTVYGYLPDSGSASSVYLVAPCKGTIRGFKSVLQGTTVGTADNTFTAFIGSTAITHDTWTQPTSGSAAGDRVEVNATAANRVYEGDMIKVTSDGAGTNVTPTGIYAYIQPN
jgi:hypothetical protein